MMRVGDRAGGDRGREQADAERDQAKEHRGAGDVLGVDVGAGDPDHAYHEYAEDGDAGAQAPCDQQAPAHAGRDRRSGRRAASASAVTGRSARSIEKR